MCNGITKTGKPCGRKAEWCAQHIGQKPVVEGKKQPAAPVVSEPPVVSEETIEVPVAIEIPVSEKPVVDKNGKENAPEEFVLEECAPKEEFVRKNIESPMSPNASSIPSSQSDSAILVETKPESGENISKPQFFIMLEIGDFDLVKTHFLADTAEMTKMTIRTLIDNGHKIVIHDRPEKPTLSGEQICISCYFYENQEDSDAGKYHISTVRYIIESEATYGSTADNIDEILDLPQHEVVLRSKSYDEYLYDLCCLIPCRWFNDKQNLWEFSRFIYQMPGTDSVSMRCTYAAILAFHYGDMFDQATEMGSYDHNGPITKYPVKLSVGTLKSIAGGTKSDEYAEWKAKYESEVVPETKKTKKTSSDDERKKPIVLMKEKLIQVSSDMYRVWHW